VFRSVIVQTVPVFCIDHEETRQQNGLPNFHSRGAFKRLS
jgi:hypothetical protein